MIEATDGTVEAPLVGVLEERYAGYGRSANARSIPDARDGLKPVHRRVLYGVADVARTKLVKSARIVGEILGE